MNSKDEITYAQPLLESSPCPLCGESEIVKVIETPDRLCGCPGIFRVGLCVNCSLMRQEPRVPPDRIGAYYPEDYIVYTRESPPRVGRGRSEPWRKDWLSLATRDKPPSAVGSVFYRAFLRLFAMTPRARFNPLAFRTNGKRLLDVGCGVGNFALEMQALGWNVDGIERDPAAADRARERGLHAVTGSFPDITGELDGHYDAVTLNQVIEHMTNPLAALSAVRGLLKPGGLLVVWTPWRDGLAARLFGSFWFALEQPRHYVLFTRRHIRTMMKKAGLRVAAAMDHSSTASWTRSLEYQFPRSRLTRKLDQRRSVHRLLNPFVRLLDILGLGDGGVVVAVRENE